MLTAGFAYLASNSQPNVSAGESVAAVSGYTVTNVTFNGGGGSACGYGYPGSLSGGSTGTVNPNAGCQLNAISFTLTAKGTNLQANGAPNFVYVDLIDTNLPPSSDQLQNAYLSGSALTAAESSISPGSAGSGWSATISVTFSPGGTSVVPVNAYSITATQ